MFTALQPDVVVLDLHLPDGFGFDVGVHVRRALPDTRIVVLSEHVHPKVLSGLPDSEQPYWSYLLKTHLSSQEDLVSAVHLACAQPVVDGDVREPSPTADELRLDLLTDRQRQILALVAAGLSNSAIAERVFMSQKSVEYHLTQIYQQLEVATDPTANARVQAVLRYVEHERTGPPQ